MSLFPPDLEVFILKENQTIDVLWSSRSKSYYESLGYKFTFAGDVFTIPVEQLKPTALRKVICICDMCGAEFASNNNTYSKRRSESLPDLCPSCQVVQQHKTKRAESVDQLFNKLEDICKENDYTLLTQNEDYINNTEQYMYINFICSRHGSQKMLMSNFLKGHRCIDCSYEYRADNFRHSPDYIEQIINSKNGNTLLNKDEYTGSTVPNLKVKCGNCNGEHIYTVSFSDYVSNNQITCRYCSRRISKGELAIRKFLDDNNIQYEPEYTFKDCVDKRPLPFDFYLENYNLIIEYDGEQHFEQISNHHDFDMVRKHDAIKNKYCEEHNINLLRIPYWDYENINDILKEEIIDIK